MLWPQAYKILKLSVSHHTMNPQRSKNNQRRAICPRLFLYHSAMPFTQREMARRGKHITQPSTAFEYEGCNARFIRHFLMEIITVQYYQRWLYQFQYTSHLQLFRGNMVTCALSTMQLDSPNPVLFGNHWRIRRLIWYVLRLQPSSNSPYQSWIIPCATTYHRIDAISFLAISSISSLWYIFSHDRLRVAWLDYELWRRWLGVEGCVLCFGCWNYWMVKRSWREAKGGLPPKL